MSLTRDHSDKVSAAMAGSQRAATLRLRSYQAEMVEASLRENIIVAMDTGSGKTHIALSRTAAELERCDPQQLVWFLAPTVALCQQQHGLFKVHLPGFGTQLLTGNDGVHRWSEQRVWDEALCNVRIVLSTHQVLLDALTHGFITMDQLALLIFDEAHHCAKSHPASRIMTSFYLPHVHGTVAKRLPRILGLSASPIRTARASISSLRQIEENLNATTKTPKVHRSELLECTHKPELLRIDYHETPLDYENSCLLKPLEKIVQNYDLQTDPYVVNLLEQYRKGHNVTTQLQKLATSQKSTYCFEQLKTLLAKSKAMAAELGSSTVDWYLHLCISKYEKMVRNGSQSLLDMSTGERQHLLRLLKSLSLQNDAMPLSISFDHLSQKVEALIDVLVDEYSQELTGLVFVEQRVWVAALSEILSTHPRTKNKFKIGTFVGSSESTKRTVDMGSLAEPKNQKNTLEDFRAGETNLILTTSVLEEGIDISSCHLVICFDPPKTLKSFVQRRGRARKQKSKYFVFAPDNGKLRTPQVWTSLEQQMVSAYLDDMRKVKEAEKRELQSEDGQRFYRVEKTGALLTLDNASQHLHQFCALLGSGPYLDLRPQFEFSSTAQGNISAEVILPLSVDPAIRYASSLECWSTERMAKNDAAFEAYKALHGAGLVNDNLLPSRQEADDQAKEFQAADTTPSLIEVAPTFDPWQAVARCQQDNSGLYYRTLLTLLTSEAPEERPFSIILLTSIPMPSMPQFTLHWNETKKYSIGSSWLPEISLSREAVQVARSITKRILSPVFHGRMQSASEDFMWLLIPSDPPGITHDIPKMRKWLERRNGCFPALDLIMNGYTDTNEWGLVSMHGDLRKYFPISILTDNITPTAGSEGMSHLQVIKTPKRRDFLHPVIRNSEGNEAHTKAEVLAAGLCQVDSLPVPYSILALFLPSILHKLEIYMIAETVRTTLLKPAKFEVKHLPLVVRALTSSSTGEDEDYQRLEFLGDCILKLVTSVHLMADKPTWPEGWLTGQKGKIVCNGFLARASLAAGLDQFIITKRFTGLRWSPRYTGDVLAKQHEYTKEKKSSKLVADVIESLIGLCYTVGGFNQAFTCIQTLLPLEKSDWISLPEANAILYQNVPMIGEKVNLQSLEALIGYTFRKKSLLLEALTHGSCQMQTTKSYERLEFLGDAVLDYIIDRRLFSHEPSLSHRTMHGIRSALANASFLTFRMFETTMSEDIVDPLTLLLAEENKNYKKHEIVLSHFLRGSPTLLEHSRRAFQDHRIYREQVLAALEHDSKFPWHLFSLTDPPKFLSDIVESVIGALYIDSKGDIATCEMFVRRLGVFDYLERILRVSVDCLHPKERLGHLAIEKKVKYVLVDRHERLKEDRTPEMNRYRCQVKVGNKNVGDVTEGSKKMNAETLAAWKAIKILENGGTGELKNTNEDADVNMDDSTVAEEEQWHDAEEGEG